MRLRFSALLILGFLISVQCLHAQSPRPVPYSGQLRTDPSVGNVQGIQRYGRPLRTDPDQGEGFSYHVYPVAESRNSVVTSPVATGYGLPASTNANEFAQIKEAYENLVDATRLEDPLQKKLQTKAALAAIEQAKNPKNKVTQSAEVTQSARSSQATAGPVVVTQSAPQQVPTPRHSTGLREFAIPHLRAVVPMFLDPRAQVAGRMVRRSPIRPTRRWFTSVPKAKLRCTNCSNSL